MTEILASRYAITRMHRQGGTSQLMQLHKLDEQLVRTLAGSEADGPLVSIYLPVTHQPGELDKNRIRVKNATRDAGRQLESAKMDERAAASMLKPLEEAGDDLFSHPAPGVGVFLGGDEPVFAEIPAATAEFVLAASHFHVKPLIAALPHAAGFSVLALSENSVRLLRGDGYTLEPVDTGRELPRSLADVAGHDLSERQLQHHAGDRGSAEAIYHGQGAGKDDKEPEVERFLRKVDEVLNSKYLRGQPLILAGVSGLLAQYRKASEYQEILDEEIAGNADSASPDELHVKALPIFEAHARSRRQAALAELCGGDIEKPVVEDLEETVIAAGDGRIGRLFVASDTVRWGRYDADSRAIETSEEREALEDDLLDRLAAAAWMSGAMVYAVPADDLPDGESLALLRY
jgi:hypothetical protein